MKKIIKRTKGYEPEGCRKACVRCRHVEITPIDNNIGGNWLYCTKIEPNFEVIEGDCCDEFEY